MWKRGCNDFYREDDWGNKIKDNPNDKCTYINGYDCPTEFDKCVQKGDCSTFLQFSFNPPSGITTILDATKKINPMDAYRLLGRFGFGSYLADPEPGKMRYYKIQSVDSWLQDLNAICQPDCCHTLQRMVKSSVRQELNKILRGPNAANFKQYLEVLVSWVNANPTVLNPDEYDLPMGAGVNPTGAFSIYKYVPPAPTNVNIYQQYCDIDRLKASITGNMIYGMRGGGPVDNLTALWNHVKMYMDPVDEDHLQEQLDRVQQASDDMSQQEIINFLDNVQVALGKKMM